MKLATPNVESLFHAALDLSTPAEIEAYLDQACGDDAELRRRVEKLLAAHRQAGSFLEPTPSGPEAAASASDLEGSGTVIGPYHLLEELGEGGFGVVYLAEQFHPVRRRVALKILKPGMDTRQVVARFEAERQALAIMDHPSIAKVLDAGTTGLPISDGRLPNEGQEPACQSPIGNRQSEIPYFVMELVKGVPITEYCERNQLGPRERLELFVPVCQAVQHAHQKGIIHRDLKPSNVLVAHPPDPPLNKGGPRGVPKVIDFGVAKAIGPALTDESLHTGIAQMIGTPLYMAPEQAGAAGLDVDTRSDVYSLGVLLYELLTGTTPFAKDRFKKLPYDEIRRIIREEEPPRPSSRVSSMGSARSGERSVERGTPGAFLSTLHAPRFFELDWIVMKCLEKDRERRYATANGLALDVQRYLANEPVLAGPPSARYRLRKLASKYRKAIATAAAFLVLLVTGTAFSTWQAVQATRAKETAEKRLHQITKGNEILQAIFMDLDPKAEDREGKPLRAILGERLEAAVKQLEGEAIGDPLTVATLQNTLGNSLLGLGFNERAMELISSAHATYGSLLGMEHHDTLSTLNNLAICHHQLGNYDLAASLHQRTLAQRQRQLGPNDPRTLGSMNGLAEAYRESGQLNLAIQLHERTLELRKAALGSDHRDTIQSMNNLGVAYVLSGREALAAPLLEDTLRLCRLTFGPEQPYTLATMGHLANAYRAIGRMELMLPLLEESTRLTMLRLGPDHRDTWASMGNLAATHRLLGRPDLALPINEDLLKRFRARLGPDHADTLVAMNDLGLTYQASGQVELALATFEELLQRAEATLGTEHLRTLTSMNNLAQCYRNANKPDRALPLLTKTLQIRRVKLGADHPNTLISINNLATCHRAAGRLEEALALHEEAFKLAKARWGIDHPDTIAYLANLASCQHAAGNLVVALPLFAEALGPMRTRLGTDHPMTISHLQNFAEAEESAGKPERATSLLHEAAQGIARRRFKHPDAGIIVGKLIAKLEKAEDYASADTWRRQWLAVVKERAGGDSIAYAAELQGLGVNLLAQEKFANGEPILRDCLAIRAKHRPDDPVTFYVQALLGTALLGQKKYAEAEPLLLAGYEGMKLRRDRIPPEGRGRMQEALDRLVQLYDRLGRKDDAEKWRKELETARGAADPRRE